MSSETLNKTPLYPAYAAGERVKLVDFGGWELPLEYGKGIVAEHAIVRESVGIFDVSHMGEILVQGPDTVDFLDWALTNDMRSVRPGKAVYSPMCYPDGGTVDDLLVYRLSESSALLVVNAANTSKDFTWLSDTCPWNGDRSRVEITNVSAEYVQIAVQGPGSERILAEMAPVSQLNYYEYLQDLIICGHPSLISRTGYTGEDGFEIYVGAKAGIGLWQELLNRGAEPVGLGARDTLRLEARLPLYGHELSESIMPTEAGLSPFVDLTKSDFCGKSAIEKAAGGTRRLRGLQMVDTAVPRQGYPVLIDGTEIGSVTSGGKSPTLGSFIALALIDKGTVKTGEEVTVSIRGKEKRATVVKTPFYRNVKK